jgi:hypothetical protein
VDGETDTTSYMDLYDEWLQGFLSSAINTEMANVMLSKDTKEGMDGREGAKECKFRG